MTTPNIEELRKLAEAATPGPWAFGTFHRLLVVQVDKHGYADKHSAIADIGAGSIPWDETAESMQEYNDAEYIAAANPAAVITLLDQLQSQAERIKELIDSVNFKHSKITELENERDELREKYTDTYWALDDAARENTSLRAQLTEIEKTEPVATINDLSNSRMFTLEANGYSRKDKLFTHPMPAQDVTELVEALQLFAYALPLDKSTIKTCYAVTDQMRDAAHAALSKYKGAKQ